MWEGLGDLCHQSQRGRTFQRLGGFPLAGVGPLRPSFTDFVRAARVVSIAEILRTSLGSEVGGALGGGVSEPRPLIRCDSLDFVMRSLSRRSSRVLSLSRMRSACQMTKPRSEASESGFEGKRFWS
jgi:hypothetical protein